MMTQRMVVWAMSLLLASGPVTLAIPQATENQPNVEIKGTITKVSPPVSLVAIQTANDVEKTIFIEPETRVTVKGKEGTVEDIKEGQFLKAVLREDSSKAVSVEVI